MNDGPTLFPVARLSCLGCRWLEFHLDSAPPSMAQDHRCGHPDAPRRCLGSRPGMEWVNMPRIPDVDNTPAWCPAKEES